jgi:molybdopterin-containing oxidoreductase family membrane subunit
MAIGHAVTGGMVLGVFAHVDTTVDAIERLKAKGFREMTVYTPVPVHEIEDVVERDRPVSHVRLFTLIGGLTGTATGFFLTIWSAMKWGLVTGGKPVVSIPPFVVIAFELTILLGGLSTVLAMLLLGRIPRLRPSPMYDPRFTRDRFGVAVRCDGRDENAVRDILTGAGAEEVRS